MQITSNMSVDEVISYFGNSIPDNILAYIESMQDTIKELESKIDKVNKSKELIDEQNYFAQELIGNLQEGLKQATRLNDYRKTFKIMLDESSFEM